MQAEDRAHRIGQTREVKIYYLMAKNTVDDYILLTLRRKMNNLDAISLNTGSFTDVKVSNEETSRKILDYFEKIAESAKEPQIKINPRKPLVSNEPITIDDDDDDFNNDDVFSSNAVKANDDVVVIDDEWSDDDVFGGIIQTKENQMKRKVSEETIGIPKKSR